MHAPEVLVADGDPDIRAMLGYALGAEFHLRFVTNGIDAVDELATNPPDALILDVVMSGMDGFDVLEARRERGLAPNVQVIMLTDRTDEHDLVRAWALGADAYLFKPTGPEQIAATLRAQLAAAADA